MQAVLCASVEQMATGRENMKEFGEVFRFGEGLGIL